MVKKIVTEEEKILKIEEYFKSGHKLKEYTARIGVGRSTFDKSCWSPGQFFDLNRDIIFCNSTQWSSYHLES